MKDTMDKIHSLMKSSLTVSIMVLVTLIACQKTDPSKDVVIARLDERVITLDEFRLFYELDPNFGIGEYGFPAIRKELEFFMLQILAHQFAQAEGLDQDTLFRMAVRWEENQAMLRQLYRQEVDQNIEIEENELRQEYLRRNAQVHLRHLFSTEEDTIQQWLSELRKGRSFAELAVRAFRDTALARRAGDLGWINMNELDEDFVSGVDTLQAGTISRPIRTRWGWHLAEVINRRQQLILPEDVFQQQKESLKKKVKQRKGKKIAHHFISNQIGSINPQLHEETFRKLLLAIVPPLEQEKGQLSSRVVLSNTLLDQLQEYHSHLFHLPFINYKNGSIRLSVYLQEVRQMPVSNRPAFRTPREFSNQIGAWARDYFLLQRARDQELHQHPRIREEVQRFREEQSYTYYLHAILDTMETPSSIEAYFKNRMERRVLPGDTLQSYHTLQEWRYAKAKRLLEKQLNNIPHQRSINWDLLREEVKHINWDRRVPMFMIRKPS